MTHPEVQHPRELLAEIRRERNRIVRANDKLLSWLAHHVLASMITFDVALLLPLLVLPMSDGIKLAMGVVSGSWFQWWALPALQRTQEQADEIREAKALTDHRSMTHIAATVDEILRRCPPPPSGATGAADAPTGGDR